MVGNKVAKGYRNRCAQAFALHQERGETKLSNEEWGASLRAHEELGELQKGNGRPRNSR